MPRSSRSRSTSQKNAEEAPKDSAADPSQAIRDSAQKIWLAGLGAFERARTDGPRMFETLVEQGRKMGARAVGAADEALKTMREANYTAGGRWDKLEQVFEERVSKSLGRLGVVTARELSELSRQVNELNQAVAAMAARGAREASGGKPGAGGKKGARRKAAGSAKRKAKGASRASRARRA